jgi:hypothetical protein
MRRGVSCDATVIAFPPHSLRIPSIVPIDGYPGLLDDFPPSLVFQSDGGHKAITMGVDHDGGQVLPFASDTLITRLMRDTDPRPWGQVLPFAFSARCNGPYGALATMVREPFVGHHGTGRRRFSTQKERCARRPLPSRRQCTLHPDLSR